MIKVIARHRRKISTRFEFIIKTLSFLSFPSFTSVVPPSIPCDTVFSRFKLCEKLRCSFALSAFPTQFFVCPLSHILFINAGICIFDTYFPCVLRSVKLMSGLRCAWEMLQCILYENLRFKWQETKQSFRIVFHIHANSGKVCHIVQVCIRSPTDIRHRILVSLFFLLFSRIFSSSERREKNGIVVCTILITACMAWRDVTQR